MGRRWTAAEMGLVRELHATHTASQIAARLPGEPRNAVAIYRLAHRLGLRKWPRWPATVIERVRLLHTEGLNDADIARRMPDVFSDRLQVKHIRHDLLKLPKNVASIQASARRAAQKQSQTLGTSPGGELRALAHRRYAIENGWPEDCRPREVQILNALAARGVPMTRRELCAAIGMADHETFASGKRRILLSGNGPGGTYTATLLRRGLLTRHCSAGPPTRPGASKRLDLYSLGPVALQILERRATCANQTAS